MAEQSRYGRAATSSRSKSAVRQLYRLTTASTALERLSQTAFRQMSRPTPIYQLNPAAGDQPPSSPLPASFTLAARPDTDIWRKPPSTFSFNAPILYHDLKLAAFKRARVTVSGPWKALYDQGGLCLYMPTAAKGDEKGDEKSWKWVKTGIEFYEGKPHIGDRCV